MGVPHSFILAGLDQDRVSLRKEPVRTWRSPSRRSPKSPGERPRGPVGKLVRVDVRFRVWMPPIAVLIVLVAVSSVFAYGIPAAKQRLEQRTQALTLAQAAATADAITGEDHRAWQQLLNLSEPEEGGQEAPGAERPGALGRSLELYATAPGAEIRVVDREGEVVAREGEPLLSPPPEMLRRAARGERFFETTGDLNVAVVPILYGGRLAGGVVFTTRQWEGLVYEPLLRSGLEAAVLASLVGGGLMFLLAAVLSRRVERLSSGARLMERGDLSHRIEPGFGDELGTLAKALNSMAAGLEESFGRLAEKDATLGAILDNLSEGVVATDARGRVIFANPAGRAMLGIGEGGAELTSPWEDFDLGEAVATCALKREGGEARVRGGRSFLRIKLEHVPKLGGEDGVLIVAQDLSEGRRLEETQQKFLANAAHQLRTPLSSITLAAELLVAKGDEDPLARRRFLGHILAGAERMRLLSDSLLKLARVGWGRREPKPEPVDLSDVARAAVEIATPLAESEGLDVTVEGPSVRVVADPALLEEVLLIPLANAIQHSSSGQSVRLRMSGTSVTVEDQAGGIPEEDLPHLFERFYSPGRGSSGGFGLGLPICKELVERMGGEVSVRSEKGVGTSVTIKLPGAGPDA